MLKVALRLFSLSIILFLFSCATVPVELPVYEGVNIQDDLSSRNRISAIDGIFSIVFEKEDTEMRGDGMMHLVRNGDLNLRLYSLGFLALELTSEKGVIRSNPKIDRGRGAILTSGLRDCFFWWDMENYDIDEKEDVYLISNQTRMVWVDKKTILPKKQIIILEDGREISIYYESFEKVNNVFFPAMIRIELAKYSVTLKLKEISFTSV